MIYIFFSLFRKFSNTIKKKIWSLISESLISILLQSWFYNIMFLWTSPGNITKLFVEHPEEKKKKIIKYLTITSIFVINQFKNSVLMKNDNILYFYRMKYALTNDEYNQTSIQDNSYKILFLSVWMCQVSVFFILKNSHKDFTQRLQPNFWYYQGNDCN